MLTSVKRSCMSDFTAIKQLILLLICFGGLFHSVQSSHCYHSDQCHWTDYTYGECDSGYSHLDSEWGWSWRCPTSCYREYCCRSCDYSWWMGGWGSCSRDCGGGSQSRLVYCGSSQYSSSATDDWKCHGDKPSSVRACNTAACSYSSPPPPRPPPPSPPPSSSSSSSSSLPCIQYGIYSETDCENKCDSGYSWQTVNQYYYTCSCAYSRFSCTHSEKPSNNDDQDASTDDVEDDSTAAIVAGAAGGLAFIGILACSTAYFISKKRRQAKSELYNAAPAARSNVHLQPTMTNLAPVSASDSESQISVAHAAMPVATLASTSHNQTASSELEATNIIGAPPTMSTPSTLTFHQGYSINNGEMPQKTTDATNTAFSNSTDSDEVLASNMPMFAAMKRAQLVAFYEKYNPEQVVQVDAILEAYSMDEIKKTCIMRYNADPF